MFDTLRTATVESATPMELLVVGKEDFVRIFMKAENPDDDPDHVKFLKYVFIVCFLYCLSLSPISLPLSLSLSSYLTFLSLSHIVFLSLIHFSLTLFLSLFSLTLSLSLFSLTLSILSHSLSLSLSLFSLTLFLSLSFSLSLFSLSFSFSLSLSLYTIQAQVYKIDILCIFVRKTTTHINSILLRLTFFCFQKSTIYVQLAHGSIKA